MYLFDNSDQLNYYILQSSIMHIRVTNLLIIKYLVDIDVVKNNVLNSV